MIGVDIIFIFKRKERKGFYNLIEKIYGSQRRFAQQRIKIQFVIP